MTDPNPAPSASTSSSTTGPDQTLIGRVILAVSAIALVSTVGIIALALDGVSPPDVLQNLAVGALTGLCGLLVGTRRPG